MSNSEDKATKPGTKSPEAPKGSKSPETTGQATGRQRKKAVPPAPDKAASAPPGSEKPGSENPATEKPVPEQKAAQGAKEDTRPATPATKSDTVPTPGGDAPPGGSKPQGGGPGRGGSGAALLLATLAFLLSLGVGGALFYLWQEGVDTRAEQARQLERLNAAMESRDERLSRLSDALERETRERADLGERADARLGTVEQGLNRLQDRTTRQARGWQIAEIKHLQRMASHRLNLMDDPDGAMKALRAADALLANMGDPRLTPVRQAIAGEIQALEDMPRPDVEGIALRLGQLAHDLRPLPLKGQAVPDLAARERIAGDAVSEDAPWWHRALGEVREALAEHVSIRRHGEPLRMMPDAETELFLRQLLTLRVEAARVAALRLDDGQYHRNLEGALTLLTEHFDPAATGNIRERLENLRSVTLRPEAPDISGSFTRLDELEG